MRTCLPDLHQEALRKKQLIFTVTTGRSGTSYLARLLACFPGIQSAHEPEPDFSEVMRAAQRAPDLAYSFLTRKKIPAIAAINAPVYAETGHLFCKGFVEPLLDMGVVPDIIVLTRPHREVATSLYKLNTIPARTQSGEKYLLQPDDPGVLLVEGWEDLHDYQLCYWYCLEIERRARRYEKMVREASDRARVVWTSVSDLGTRPAVEKFACNLALPELNLSGKVKLSRLLGKKLNTKPGSKRKSHRPEISSLDELEAEVHERIAA